MVNTSDLEFKSLSCPLPVQNPSVGSHCLQDKVPCPLGTPPLQIQVPLLTPKPSPTLTSSLNSSLEVSWPSRYLPQGVPNPLTPAMSPTLLSISPKSAPPLRPHFKDSRPTHPSGLTLVPAPPEIPPGLRGSPGLRPRPPMCLLGRVTVSLTHPLSLPPPPLSLPWLQPGLSGPLLSSLHSTLPIPLRV